jgi:hypothetical protein
LDPVADAGVSDASPDASTDAAPDGPPPSPPPPTCVPAPDVTLPDPSEQDPDMPIVPATGDPGTALCGEGMVPQPADYDVPRDGPPTADLLTAVPDPDAPILTDTTEPVVNIAFGAPFFYATAQADTRAGTIGASANLTQHNPHVGARDVHSLGEVAALDVTPSGRNIVEIGWSVFNGAPYPQLFVYHWINDHKTCYNGCGYVQVSPYHYPGMQVAVTGTPQLYYIRQMGGAWWLNYQGDWIGYFPNSIWRGNFTRANQTQYFGEVEGQVRPCTQMGDGIFGGNAGAAAMTNLLAWTAAGPYVPGFMPMATRPAWYTIRRSGGNNFTWGGPGPGCF